MSSLCNGILKIIPDNYQIIVQILPELYKVSIHV